MNEFTFGTTRFSLRDRVHTEEIVRGKGSAIITALKEWEGSVCGAGQEHRHLL